MSEINKINLNSQNTEKPLNKNEVIKNNQTYSINNCMTSYEHININLLNILKVWSLYTLKYLSPKLYFKIIYLNF